MVGTSPPGTPEALARILYERFEAFHTDFVSVASRAEGRFLAGDWHGRRQGAFERLNLHTDAVLGTVMAVFALPSFDIVFK